MKTGDAVALIEAAVGPSDRQDQVWADLGAGTGTFTRALAQLLGPTHTIYAVDRDAGAIASVAKLTTLTTSLGSRVIPVHADFGDNQALSRLIDGRLDGMLLANALHFVRDQERVLAELVARLRPAGRVVFVEYDRRSAGRWVPYPISIERLEALASAAGLSTPTVTATRPSAYSGVLYAAVATSSNAD